MIEGFDTSVAHGLLFSGAGLLLLLFAALLRRRFRSPALKINAENDTEIHSYVRLKAIEAAQRRAQENKGIIKERQDALRQRKVKRVIDPVPKEEERPFWDLANAYTVDDLENKDITTRMTVELKGIGGEWIKIRALLDTGNAGLTLIKLKTARMAGLVDFDGRPKHAYMGKVGVRGVVKGAREDLEKTAITYRVGGQEMACVAGLSDNYDSAWELLVSVDEIRALEKMGFNFTAG